jgi:hypothetical protein
MNEAGSPSIRSLNRDSREYKKRPKTNHKSLEII